MPIRENLPENLRQREAARDIPADRDAHEKVRVSVGFPDLHGDPPGRHGHQAAPGVVGENLEIHSERLLQVGFTNFTFQRIAIYIL